MKDLQVLAAVFHYSFNIKVCVLYTNLSILTTFCIIPTLKQCTVHLFLGCLKIVEVPCESDLATIGPAGPVRHTCNTITNPAA